MHEESMAESSSRPQPLLPTNPDEEHYGEAEAVVGFEDIPDIPEKDFEPLAMDDLDFEQDLELDSRDVESQVEGGRTLVSDTLDHKDGNDAQEEDNVDDAREEDTVDDAEEGDTQADKSDLEASSQLPVVPELVDAIASIDTWRAMGNRDETLILDVYLLVSFLLLQGLVSDRVGSLLLSSFHGLLSQALGRSVSGARTGRFKDLYTTPQAMLRALGIRDTFQRYIVCNNDKCQRLYEWPAQVTRCSVPRCLTMLVKGNQPVKRYAHRTIASVIRSVLANADTEEQLEEWRQWSADHQAETGHVYSTMWSGDGWQADCCNAGCSTPCTQGHGSFVDQGGYIKITLSLDWYKAFKGLYSGSHSSGALLMRIDNMPERFSTLDQRANGIFVLGILPGPKDQAIAQLSHYMRLVVDELKELYTSGIVVKSPKYPSGRTIRVKLNMLVADSPARAKLAGTQASFLSGKTCPQCYFDLKDLGKVSPVQPMPRGPEHGKKSLECVSKQVEKVHKLQGIHYSVFYELPYFTTDMCPPDPMHAIYMGLCKRFWYITLVKACPQWTSNLKVVKSMIEASKLPSIARKPDSRIGLPSGGNPSAEAWSGFFHHVFPFILMQLWSLSLGESEPQSLNFGPTVEQKKDPILFDSSKTRPVIHGEKPVERLFKLALLLTTIISFLERSLNRTEIKRLAGLIDEYNAVTAEVFGTGWLTHNNHVSTHIADFIFKYGAARNFSAMPFETTNGIIGRMSKSTRKGGIMEESVVRIADHRAQIESILKESHSFFLRDRLLTEISGDKSPPGTITETIWDKKDMDSDTLIHFIHYLNGRRVLTGERGVYKSVFDPSFRPNIDMYVDSNAQHFHSLVTRFYPKPARVSSSRQGGSLNLGNTYVKIATRNEDEPVVAQVLCLFKKSVADHPNTPERDMYFAHIQELKLVAITEAVGPDVPDPDLFREASGFIADTQAAALRERIVPFNQISKQLGATPFTTHRGSFLGMMAV